MPSRASRRKQCVKKRKKVASKAAAAAALRASARTVHAAVSQDADPDDDQHEACKGHVQSDLEKLQELAPDMTGSIIAQVLVNSASVDDAGAKLVHMTNPRPAGDEAAPDSYGAGKITIPAVDNEDEYPQLSATVDCAYEVLAKSDADDSDGDDDGGSDASSVVDEFVLVTDSDVTDWLLIESTDHSIPPMAAKSSYAQAACS